MLRVGDTTSCSRRWNASARAPDHRRPHRGTHEWWRARCDGGGRPARGRSARHRCPRRPSSASTRCWRGVGTHQSGRHGVRRAAGRYADAPKALIEDEAIDATLVLHAPGAQPPHDSAAKRSSTQRDGAADCADLLDWRRSGSRAKMFADAGMPTTNPTPGPARLRSSVRYNRNRKC